MVGIEGNGGVGKHVDSHMCAVCVRKASVHFKPLLAQKLDDSPGLLVHSTQRLADILNALKVLLNTLAVLCTSRRSPARNTHAHCMTTTCVTCCCCCVQYNKWGLAMVWSRAMTGGGGSARNLQPVCVQHARNVVSQPPLTAAIGTAAVFQGVERRLRWPLTV